MADDHFVSCSCIESLAKRTTMIIKNIDDSHTGDACCDDGDKKCDADKWPSQHAGSAALDSSSGKANFLPRPSVPVE